ncbi:CoA ester lyase [uncultured Psychrobacter sp.]|uniref:HpcH/HpaI aldolase/citrate lyase family protein n=1 Tax=uncultured Psychrobacter sp. TaxID=259303 RepID=UPI0034594DD5
MNSRFANIKTWLFVPATKLELISKAFASGADAVIVDLEDAVADKDKAQAQADLKQYFEAQNISQSSISSQSRNESNQPLWLRINKAGSSEFAEDLKLCQQLPSLTGVILAKAEQAADIEHVNREIGLPVIALIESAVGLCNLDAMAKVSGIHAFSYGFLDLCNDLGVQVNTKAADIVANQIRYQLVVASKVHQLSAPIDTVYPDFNDSAGLTQRVQLWSQMGMSGMLCIHPKQVAIVQQALQPTLEELEFAKRVVEEYERSGQAVFKIDGNMVDAPVIARCRELLGN